MILKKALLLCAWQLCIGAGKGAVPLNRDNNIACGDTVVGNTAGPRSLPSQGADLVGSAYYLEVPRSNTFDADYNIGSQIELNSCGSNFDTNLRIEY